MTHEDFRRLYESGEIAVKVFVGEATIKCPDGAVERETTERRIVEAYEYNGKFYLRLHRESRWTYWRQVRHRQKLCRSGADDHFIKEFDTKTQANNYFKKFAAGYNMRQG